MADFQNSSQVAQAALVNGAREIVTSSNLLRWAKAGKLFTASQGLEATDVDSVTTEADTTPTYALVSPKNADIFVIPIEVRLALTSDGGGLSTFDVSFTKAAAQCATALVVTGTTLNIQNHLTVSGMATPQSSCLYTCTASALLTTDYITVAHQHVVDAALTTGLPLPGAGTEYAVDLLKKCIILTQGAALLVHTYTASSAGKTVPVITWAELTSSDF
jgi:hypothetical protein